MAAKRSTKSAKVAPTRSAVTKRAAPTRPKPGPATAPSADDAAASELIDATINELRDWRGKLLARLRRLIKQAVPAVVEEVKWRKPSNPMGVPVWSHDGIICTGETYQDKLKLTFAKGAALEDPAGIFNASLQGNARRAIDLREGDTLDEAAFKSVVRAAAALNAAKPKGTRSNQRNDRSATATQKLLSGGNPQIAKADGDAPVQTYIAAMPGWKRDVGRRLDALITRTVPAVRKAVRWNSPFYGIDGRGWFLSFHCFTKYIKVTFLRGTSLRPLPPVESKEPNTRYVHIPEDGQFDEELVTSWIRQAAQMDGDHFF